ncbi:MAG TPA: ATP-binding protein [Acidimicrobiales bacterium]
MNQVTQGRLATKGTYQRVLVGVIAMLASVGVLMAILLPFRAHLSPTIPALVFVVAVVVGVVIGGFWVGVVGAVVGFLVYDWFFLPPYDTLTVRSAQNWVTVGVYIAVVLIVAQVVAQLRDAREEARRRTLESQRLFELSQALIGDLSWPQLLTHIADTVQAAFEPRWTALVLPPGDHGDPAPGETLQLAATAGQPLAEADVASLTLARGETRSMGLVGDGVAGGPRKVSVALVVDERPVGMLVLQDVALEGQDQSLLGTFANQAALALDRSRLREEVLRTRLLEEIDRWRRALMGAASHDLRTPLAAVKTAVSSLRQADARLSAEDRAELLELIEQQSDRLARLVTNLLDMTRIESGALELRPTVMPLDELVDEALGNLGGIVGRDRVRMDAPPDLPMLRIDHVLVSQVLANLLDNAERVSPVDGTIEISARVAPVPGACIEIGVADEGPGIPPGERPHVFEMFTQSGRGGGAGLGLAIAKAFVEAHGGAIWVDPDTERGARIVFTVPADTDTDTTAADTGPVVATSA